MDPVWSAARQCFWEFCCLEFSLRGRGKRAKNVPGGVFGHRGSQVRKWDAAALHGAGARETYSYPYILASAGASGNDDGAEVVLGGIIIALIIASGVLRLTTSGQQSMGRGLK